MNKKFKLWGGGKMHDGVKVYRIQALEDFHDVRKGELGGYVESEDNLSFKDGDRSWIYDDSIVYGKSRIMGDSVVYKDAIIKDSRLEEGASVSHNAEIAHTRVTASEIQNAKTFYANMNNSSAYEESVVKNTRLVDSSVENYSEVYNSKLTNTVLVNGAKVSRGANLIDERLDSQEIIGDGPIRDITFGLDEAMPEGPTQDSLDHEGASADYGFERQVDAEGREFEQMTLILDDEDIADLNDLDKDLKL